MAIETLLTDAMIAKYTAAGYWGKETILNSLRTNCHLFPSKEVFVDLDSRITFGELYRRVDSLATSLVALGVKKGTVVGVQLPNCAAYIELYYALSHIGAITVPIHTPLRQKDLEDIVRRFNCEWTVTVNRYREFSFGDMHRQIKEKNPALLGVLVVGDHVANDLLRYADLTASSAVDHREQDFLSETDVDPNEVNAVFLTSGTTGGKIKGAMWTLNMFTHQGKAFNESFLVSHNDVILFAGPFTHIAFTLALNSYMQLGCKILTVQDMNPEGQLDLIEREKATVLMAVPAQFSRMLEHPDVQTRDISSLRTVISYGAAVPPELVERIRRELKCHFNLWYAATEGGYTTTKWGLPLKTQQTTVGSPERGTEWKIIDRSGHSLSAGQEGEVCINGPARCAGYYNDPELTKFSFDSEGWFHTGDLGFFDEDGNLHITGRIKDLIIRGGENILPLEVENEIFEHPSVKDVAVIGVPDPDLGEKVCACVQLNDDCTLTLNDIRAFLHERTMAYYKMPELLKIVPTFPRTETGKIQKFELKKLLTG